ncbi:MAG: UvrD-helicase domain-containing protein [Clostridiales bacterium]|nr:UvrD-helicase domain-containing protein [Clostridiales bacterium]
MRFTAGQQAAIGARNDSVLVSAAAGSGKTAVLVERVLSLLREGMQIDRMLIVTFTRAAAGEMRERIGRRLEEEGDAHLRRQALRLNRAAICTLHVFCARVLREHFQAAGIDPLCRIADEEKLTALRRRALDDALEAAYAAPSEDEQALFSQFEDPQIADMMDSLYLFLTSKPDPWGWAEEMCRAEKAEIAAWLPMLQSLCAAHLDGARELLPEMEKLANRGGGPIRYAANLEADTALTQELIRQARQETLTGGKTAFGRLSTKKAGPEESPEAAEQYKALRQEWKECIDDARRLLPEDPQRAGERLAHTLPALRALCGLTRKMAEGYFALKQARNYLDYSDLEHLTLKALSDPGVRGQVAGKFDALFIDEYQDVSALQEAIVQALHGEGGNMLFMVGDVKQSIYRFRQADPTLFLQKYRAYSLEETARQRKILLQQNFRSHENILLAVNEVFAHAMREKETEIEYDEAAMLRPGLGQPLGAPAEIHLITAQDAEAGDAGELKKGYLYEAEFAARRILELMRTALVGDGQGGTRPLRFRDIAILVRYASGRAPHIARTLQAHGIPVYSDADAEFFDLPEVTDMMNLLRVIDNPLQDIPLLSALRCPCFAFTEEDLARIRLVERRPGSAFHEAFLSVLEKEDALGEKARDAWERLAAWRFLSFHLPVDQLVWRVMEESGLYMLSGAQQDGEQRQANLRLLCERAQGESAREGLGAFLRETGRLRAGDDGKSAKTLGENEDVVRILTLHKSKGLEFPVVFLMETARAFRKKEEGPLRLHPRYGMALRHVDAEKRTIASTCAFDALGGAVEKEAKAEEARLLYVGMTRARERLILVGSPRRLDAALERWRRPAVAFAAGSADCMLDWVMQSLGGFHPGQYIGKNGSVWRMAFQQAESLTAPRQARAVPLALTAEAPAEATAQRMRRVIAAQPPLKTSVTAIAKQLRREKDDWESPADKRALPEEILVPDFLAQEHITAAQRGTITHRVLGLVDYALVREGRLAAAVKALEDKGLLTGAERDAVRLPWLRGFFASGVGRRALAAKEIHREWAFNLKGEGHTLIQGVIDLCFLEEDGWVLVDYKTDRADGEELAARYGEQMRWYARALREITGRPVKEKLLFGLRAGECRAVPDLAGEKDGGEEKN